MKAVNIKLSLAENVKSFVNIVNRYAYDVDLRAGRHGVGVVYPQAEDFQLLQVVAGHQLPEIRPSAGRPV